ncbi:uncharacterized protein LOC130749691 isoform X1 [Lotus japonicus]|uniref:uncharacterized protein LOC130749691 isoform X1 n=1 Tax=Lotus japonicus TaxID=34305 RepID=UPI002585EBCB|nr:uncharacterized protein LOC130749691 isoform X1 [Lotus japonicus]
MSSVKDCRGSVSESNTRMNPPDRSAHPQNPNPNNPKMQMDSCGSDYVVFGFGRIGFLRPESDHNRPMITPIINHIIMPSLACCDFLSLSTWLQDRLLWFFMSHDYTKVLPSQIVPIFLKFWNISRSTSYWCDRRHPLQHAFVKTYRCTYRIWLAKILQENGN